MDAGVGVVERNRLLSRAILCYHETFNLLALELLVICKIVLEKVAK